MNILVINSGSSSIKYRLIHMDTRGTICSGLIERIGEPTDGRAVHKIMPGTDQAAEITRTQRFPDHKAGFKLMVELLAETRPAGQSGGTEVNAIGHRIVQGGDRFKEACLVTPKIVEEIRDLSALAPLHNPGHAQGMETALEVFPGVPSVAVFDTEFHQTMPRHVYLYPLPYEYYTDLAVRRYGFHGTSHRYVAKGAAKAMGRKLEDLNLITCHLGNGASISAIKNGQCFDTSMGLTPLAGIMMGSRCGDVDPSAVTFVAKQRNIPPEKLDAIMNKQSGLLGICGRNDMRDVHEARAAGDEMAQLAFDMFIYRIQKYLGSYYAVLGRVDALVFTAGIGENDDLTRAAVCRGLEHMGFKLDAAANAARSQSTRLISTPDSPTAIYVVPTDEELEIAQLTQNLVFSG